MQATVTSVSRGRPAAQIDAFFDLPLVTRWTIAALRSACARSQFPPAMARTCGSLSFLGLWATGDRTSRALMAPPPQRVHASQGTRLPVVLPKVQHELRSQSESPGVAASTN
jgi:hypothetical protein